MARCAILLRGINIGPHNRIPMAELRALLTQDGFGDVTTHLQSGNVALSHTGSPEAAARRCEVLIKERFGLEIRSVVRTHAELEAVVSGDPLPEAAAIPKGYQVTFLEAAADPGIVARLAAAADEKGAPIAVAWHPEGIARSRLALLLSGPGLKVTATARDWTTVTALLSMTG